MNSELEKTMKRCFPRATRDDIWDKRETELPYFAWPGGYTINYYTKDAGVLCAKCANEAVTEGLANDPHDPQWYIVGCDIYYEGPDLYCDNCNTTLPSEYGDPDEQETIAETETN